MIIGNLEIPFPPRNIDDVMKIINNLPSIVYGIMKEFCSSYIDALYQQIYNVPYPCNNYVQFIMQKREEICKKFAEEMKMKICKKMEESLKQIDINELLRDVAKLIGVDIVKLREMGYVTSANASISK